MPLVRRDHGDADRRDRSRARRRLRLRHDAQVHRDRARGVLPDARELARRAPRRRRPQRSTCCDTLHATRWEIFRDLRFPGSMPFVFAGLRIALPLAVVGAAVAEFVAAGQQAGLGSLVTISAAQANLPVTWASIALLCLLGVLLVSCSRSCASACSGGATARSLALTRHHPGLAHPPGSSHGPRIDRPHRRHRRAEHVKKLRLGLFENAQANDSGTATWRHPDNKRVPLRHARLLARHRAHRARMPGSTSSSSPTRGAGPRSRVSARTSARSRGSTCRVSTRRSSLAALDPRDHQARTRHHRFDPARAAVLLRAPDGDARPSSPAGASAGTSSPPAQPTPPCRDSACRWSRHDERYAMADDFMEVVYKLWEQAWEPDALERDKSGRFADPAKVHRIAHDGPYFRSHGYGNTSRSPQGTPVLFQAGASPPAASSAASTARRSSSAAARSTSSRALERDPRGGRQERSRGRRR